MYTKITSEERIFLNEPFVFKRSAFTMIWGIVAAPFSGFVVWLVVGWFLGDYPIIPYLAGLLTILIILYVSIFSERIKFEIDNNELRYYKGKRLRETHVLADIGVGYHTKIYRGVGGDNDLKLKIYNYNTDKESTIDCSPLGQSRFYKLYSCIKERTREEEVQVLKAEK